MKGWPTKYPWGKLRTGQGFFVDVTQLNNLPHINIQYAPKQFAQFTVFDDRSMAHFVVVRIK